MQNNSRRLFIKNSLLATGSSMMMGVPQLLASDKYTKQLKKIQISSVKSNFEREPLIRPFGFKGGYMTEIWQTASLLKSSSGIAKVGLCSQSVLWSDATVFSKYSEASPPGLVLIMKLIYCP